MVTLLILRHGKAAPEGPSGSDRDRALTSRGQHAAQAVGQLLAADELVPDCIISSSAARARDTASEVARAAGFRGSVVERDELYLAEPDAYLAAIAELSGRAERVLLVGHNPGLEALVFILTGESVSLPTAGLVECALPVSAFAELSGSVRGKMTRFVAPKARPD